MESSEHKKLTTQILKNPDEFKNPIWRGITEDNTSPEYFYHRLLDVLRRILNKSEILFTKDIKVVEIGSGNALFLDYMRQQGISAIGIDVKPRGSKESPQAIGRIEKLPLPNDSVDLVVCSQVFSSDIYNTDQDLMMEEIARVLKHGRYFIALCDVINAKPIIGFELIPYASPLDRLTTAYKKL